MAFFTFDICFYSVFPYFFGTFWLQICLNVTATSVKKSANAVKKARTSLSNGFTTDLQFMKELRYEKEQDLFYGYLLLYLKCCMHSIVIIQE